MIDRARSALSGVVVSVLLMGPALALPAQAEDTPGPKTPTPAEHRKTAQTAKAVITLPSPAPTPPTCSSPERRPGRNPRRVSSLCYPYRRQRGGRRPGKRPRILVRRPSLARKSYQQRSVYDQDALTAAHATLPIGTRVRVTW